MFLSIGMLKQKYFLTDIFILSAEKQPIKLSWRKIEWLHSNNQKDIDVLAGLLRIIGMTVEKEDTDMLLTMVKAGLSDSHSKTQEAALMVIEQWRTRNCLIAIETAPSFNSSWLCDYAKQIESELNEELRPC